MDLITAGAIS